MPHLSFKERGLRRKFVALPCLALVSVGLITTGTVVIAQASSGNSGQVSAPPRTQYHEFQVDCAVVANADNDPIVFPGKPGYSHNHTFYGNTTTDAYSTSASLSQGSSSCTTAGDLSAYWTPTLYSHGHVVNPEHAIIYYKSGVRDYTSVKPFPPGLEFVTGDARSPSPSQFIGTWSCGNAHNLKNFPSSCPAGSKLIARIKSPSCWDGVHLSAPDHKSNMAYPVDGVCPPSYPVPVPMLEFKIPYPVNGSNMDLGLAMTPTSNVGQGYTFHDDFIADWNAADQAKLVADCINGGRQCNAQGVDPHKPLGGSGASNGSSSSTTAPHTTTSVPVTTTVPVGTTTVPDVSTTVASGGSAQTTKRLTAGFHEFQVDCGVVTNADNDPIVFPGKPGVSHNHTFYGNTTADAFSTLASLSKGGSTCTTAGDLSAYWTPTLYSHGQIVNPRHAIIYYKSGVKDYTTVQPFPQGLEFVTGDARSPSPSQFIGAWSCGDQYNLKNFPSSCPAGSLLVARIKSPSCWDGVHLSAPDHKSNMAYPVDGVCPTGYPVPVPMLEFKIQYHVNGDNMDLGLALTPVSNDGQGYTFHDDFIADWNAADQAELVSHCINGGRQCNAQGIDRHKP